MGIIFYLSSKLKMLLIDEGNGPEFTDLISNTVIQQKGKILLYLIIIHISAFNYKSSLITLGTVPPSPSSEPYNPKRGSTQKKLITKNVLPVSFPHKETIFTKS